MNAVEGRGGSAREAMNLVAERLAGLPAGRYPNLTAAAVAITEPDIDERFAFGSDCPLDGLAARAGRTGG